MKNTFFLMLLAGFALTGCRTAFPDAQTPDDVYYSPDPTGDRYERIDNDEDRYLRMKVRNRRDWNDLNDWYTYERWTYTMNQAYGTPFNPYYNWNVYHNPYWIVAATPRTPNRPRVSNLNTYQTSAGSNSTTNNNTFYNPKIGPIRSNGSGTTSGNSSTIGGGLREIFNGGGRGSSGAAPAPSGNSSGQSAPVRKF